MDEALRKNPSEAVNWYRKGADQGIVKAQIVLGFAYFQGEGVEKDLLQAYKWFTLAEKQEPGCASGELNFLKKTLPPPQIPKAQELVKEWKPEKPKGK